MRLPTPIHLAARSGPGTSPGLEALLQRPVYRRRRETRGCLYGRRGRSREAVLLEAHLVVARAHALEAVLAGRGAVGPLDRASLLVDEHPLGIGGIGTIAPEVELALHLGVARLLSL